MQELEQLCKSTNTKLIFNFIKKNGRQKQKIESKDLKTKEILKDHKTTSLFAIFFKSVYLNDNGKYRFYRISILKLMMISVLLLIVLSRH